ncbi:MAG: YlzJ-like family protein [Paenibacillaceae bacterium]
MTIYSIVPQEVIFAGIDQQTNDYIEVTVNGVAMQVEKVGANQVKIVRLLSFRPNDFLNPAYMPGTILFYQLSFAT